VEGYDTTHDTNFHGDGAGTGAIRPELSSSDGRQVAETPFTPFGHSPVFFTYYKELRIAHRGSNGAW
jgi:hypothetical protein